MGRYTGPVERLSRREGVDLELKGARRLAGKGALERRGALPPGQHGGGRRVKTSVYAQQLREKQRAKRYYGVREKQFRRLLNEAAKRNAENTVTGERLLQLLEQRVDNVVVRLGFAATRAQARQFVSHGHVLVNGVRHTIASARLKPGDVVTIKDGAPIKPLAQEATELVAIVPAWLEADHDGLSGRVLRLPTRQEIQVPITEHLIVELAGRS
ncbi:SSU ribosomal protein S4p (S9e) [Patulibacter medicamentivorans]|jgi:small subunit ribosomal protein S4|uniref:Small ribosomal subunit protein uS4 n=1 Tax=Patulibacter medicamentivorans TaxID=1097667 RepID=H0E370_9ACTN|nr:30S ribosomal protein S4 [Patulibacter medicamentivorans]EHN11869.1 SSU ribosomal protein S4p (S9e) [Patulibacter medicamentivorans]